MSNSFFNKSEYFMDDKDMDNSTKASSPNLSYPINTCEDDSYLLGNSVNFFVTEDDSEIKADIIVGYRKSIRVWGQVRNCTDKPVSCAYVKLLKSTPDGLVGVAHTITDCQGFYQFDICMCKDSNNYTVLVGKAATGEERIVSSGLSCNNSNCCNHSPTDPYSYPNYSND